MSTFTNEKADDRVIKEFMASFNGYLVTRMISREYDIRGGLAAGRSPLAAAPRRASRGTLRGRRDGRHDRRAR
jgi:hypothetical protein